MKRYLLARFFRLCYRLLLISGVILTLGGGTLMVYAVMGPSSNFGNSQNIDLDTSLDEDMITDENAKNTDQTGQKTVTKVQTVHLIWGGILIGGVVLGLAVSLRQANDFMRRRIGKVAKALDMSILGVELSLACLAWSGLSVLLSFVFPIAAVVSTSLLFLNILCAVLAWLLYGREQYKL